MTARAMLWPMRIVAVADTHLFHRELDVPDGDVFVHAGDMCRGGELDELREAAAWLAGLPHRHKIVIAGNHDWALAPCARPASPRELCRACMARGQACPGDPAPARALFEGMTYLEDTGAMIDGVRFWGSPWQPAFHDWAFNLPRGGPIAAVWRKIPPAIDVLVTHGPPVGVGDRSPVGGRAGCADLRSRIAELAPHSPRLHLFGHIHQDGGAWRQGATLFANVTTWECERAPTVIDIDGREVTPVVVPPHGRAEAESYG
jgi:hypothetical protein